MGTIDFIYDYPYPGYGDFARFQCYWSETRVSLNGCYTYPMAFNNTVPGCRHLKISIEITNTGSGTIFNRDWEFKVRKSNGSWVDVETFTLPDTGLYTVDCDIDNLDITMFAFVPSSNPGSSKKWSSWYVVEQLTLTETLEVQETGTGMFQYGVFANRSGLKKTLQEVYANVDGVLVPAKDILVNFEGRLYSLPRVHSAYIKTESESTSIFVFIPEEDGQYCITQKDISGDHELRLYTGDFEMMYDDYFYTKSFSLTEGSVYYITITHYYDAEISESYLQIYKEA